MIATALLLSPYSVARLPDTHNCTHSVKKKTNIILDMTYYHSKMNLNMLYLVLDWFYRTKGYVSVAFFY